MNHNDALEKLKSGNQAYKQAFDAGGNLVSPIKPKSPEMGQQPFAVIVSCSDSRVPPELVFNCGLVEIFIVRVAGNILNESQLGSIEFACKLAGTKVVVVLGHTACGAVKGACDDARLGNLTLLLSRIRAAVDAVKEPAEAADRNSKNAAFVNAVAEKNVALTIENTRNQSPVLKEMEESGQIKIVGAMYDIADGKVHWI